MQGQSFSKKELEAIRHIRNRLMHKGEVPSTRELMDALGYKSPRSAALLIASLVEKRVLKKKKDGGLRLIKDPTHDSMNAKTVDVPLVGVVAVGLPILAEENIEGAIPVSVKLAHPGSKYFLLRVEGDSMDEAGINDGDLVLVRQQSTADDREIVVALIDNEATIKELHRTNDAVVLNPRSSNKEHKPIILTEDFRVQGVVKATIPNLEK